MKDLNNKATYKQMTDFSQESRKELYDKVVEAYRKAHENSLHNPSYLWFKNKEDMDKVISLLNDES